jgi:uncharacterized protein (DUF302 family)
MTTLGLRRETRRGFDDVRAALPELLKTEGFGILTEVDVRETMKQKLSVEFRRFKILGACNPSLAHQALSLDLRAGMMMPCNVSLYEADDGTTVVMAVDPTQLPVAQGDSPLAGLAREVRDRLGRVLERLG